MSEEKNLDDFQDFKSLESSHKSIEEKNDINEEIKEDEEGEEKESYYILEDVTKEGLQKFLRDNMLVFNERYSVSKKAIEDDVEIVSPTYDLIFRY
eukprot:CAMPEP_0205811828 /NCGR_PEP_ID=MMETSP0205-20121125/16110_1 /ASSEMBLY_ACC=CAM_ASM_000278 /TAXON_ID=36767 /ORGANISM="Euplotes focardii, Strain TN1" /LENGTH=95 /DNA_ID=CAMNT_0053091553 /DNA_START=103 /DNA_END=390 /DNA_ORIENTATION=+